MYSGFESLSDLVNDSEGCSGEPAKAIFITVTELLSLQHVWNFINILDTVNTNGFLSQYQFSRNQLPRDQLSRDQLAMRSTLMRSTCHEINSFFLS